MEYFRLGDDGRMMESRDRLISGGSNYGETFFGNSPGLLPWLFGGRRDYDGSPIVGRPPRDDSWRSENDGRFLRPPQPIPGPEQRRSRSHGGGWGGTPSY